MRKKKNNNNNLPYKSIFQVNCQLAVYNTIA